MNIVPCDTPTPNFPVHILRAPLRQRDFNFLEPLINVLRILRNIRTNNTFNIKHKFETTPETVHLCMGDINV